MKLKVSLQCVGNKFFIVQTNALSTALWDGPYWWEWTPEFSNLAQIKKKNLLYQKCEHADTSCRSRVPLWEEPNFNYNLCPEGGSEGKRATLYSKRLFGSKMVPNFISKIIHLSEEKFGMLDNSDLQGQLLYNACNHRCGGSLWITISHITNSIKSNLVSFERLVQMRSCRLLFGWIIHLALKRPGIEPRTS